MFKKTIFQNTVNKHRTQDTEHRHRTQNTNTANFRSYLLLQLPFKELTVTSLHDDNALRNMLTTTEENYA